MSRTRPTNAPRRLFSLTQRYQAPAPFVAAWLQAKPPGAPAAWAVRTGSIEARHRVEPAGDHASVLHIEAATTSRALSVLGPLVKLALLPRAWWLARRCGREWRLAGHKDQALT